MNTNQTENERHFDIVDGPGRDRLFHAMEYAYDDDVKIPIKFTVVASHVDSEDTRDDPGLNRVYVGISGIRMHTLQHEDGSGCSFNLEGTCTADLTGGYKFYSFKAYYNAKTRKGTITFG